MLRAGSIAIWALAVTSLLSSSVLLYLRRGIQPNKARLAPLIILGNVLCIVTVVPYWVAAPVGFAVGDWVLRIGLGVVYFSRFFSLWFRFQLTEGRIKGLEQFRQQAKERRKKKGVDVKSAPGSPRHIQASPFSSSNLQNQLSENIMATNVYEKYRYLISNRFIAIGCCIVLAIFALWPLIIGLVDPTCSICVTQTYSLALVGLEILLIGSIGGIVSRIDSKYDNFGLRAEYICTASSWFLLSPLTLLISLSPGLSSLDAFMDVRRLLIACFLLCISVISSWYPLFLSTRMKSEKFSKNPSVATLEGILMNPKAKELFREFLKGEFCTENLFFYEDAFEFRESTLNAYLENEDTLKADVDVLDFAREIFETYISKNSISQVNLPHTMFDRITSELEAFEQLVQEKLKKYEEEEIKKATEDQIPQVLTEKFSPTAKRGHRRDASDASLSQDMVIDLYDQDNTGTITQDMNDIEIPRPTNATDSKEAKDLKDSKELKDFKDSKDSVQTPSVTSVTTFQGSKGLKKKRLTRSSGDDLGRTLSGIETGDDADAERRRKKSESVLRRNKSCNIPSWDEFMAEQASLKQEQKTETKKENNEEVKPETRPETTSNASQEVPIDKNAKLSKQHKRSRSKNISIGNWQIEVSAAGISLEGKRKKKIRSRASILREHTIVTVFDKALQEVFDLMRSGAFGRFVNSAAYYAFVSELKTQHHQQAAMRDLKLL